MSTPLRPGTGGLVGGGAGGGSHGEGDRLGRGEEGRGASTPVWQPTTFSLDFFLLLVSPPAITSLLLCGFLGFLKLLRWYLLLSSSLSLLLFSCGYTTLPQASRLLPLCPSSPRRRLRLLSFCPCLISLLSVNVGSFALSLLAPRLWTRTQALVCGRDPHCRVSRCIWIECVPACQTQATIRHPMVMTPFVVVPQCRCPSVLVWSKVPNVYVSHTLTGRSCFTMPSRGVSPLKQTDAALSGVLPVRIGRTHEHVRC